MGLGIPETQGGAGGGATEIAIVIAAADVKQDETVEGITMACRMDFGIHDIEAGAAEKAHHACK